MIYYPWRIHENGVFIILFTYWILLNSWFCMVNGAKYAIHVYMDPMGIPISNDLLSISETTVAPLKTWWFCWKNGKTTFVLGKPIFRGEIVVSGRGYLCSACLGGVDTSYFGKARFSFGQSRTGVLHPASWWYATCHCQPPRSVMSAERPRVVPLAVAELQLCCEKRIEIIECHVWYLYLYEDPIKINQTHGSVNTPCSLCRLTTLNQVLQSVWRPAERRPDTQGQPFNCVGNWNLSSIESTADHWR